LTAPVRGLLCPITTPFSPGGDADPGRLAAQIEIYEGLSVAGVVVFGTSGEGPLVDPDEEAGLLAAARAALGSHRTLAVQVGHESVRATVASARRAEAAGADAILSLPPRYYPVTPDGLRAMAGLVVLREKVIKPLLTHRGRCKPGSKTRASAALDAQYQAVQRQMQHLFKLLHIAA